MVIRDTAQLKEGNFFFTGIIKGPTKAFITGKTKSRSVDDPNFTEVFLEPTNMTIVLTPNDFKHSTITGSFTQNEVRDLESGPSYKEIEQLEKEFNSNRDLLSTIRIARYFEKSRILS